MAFHDRIGAFTLAGMQNRDHARDNSAETASRCMASTISTRSSFGGDDAIWESATMATANQIEPKGHDRRLSTDIGARSRCSPLSQANVREGIARDLDDCPPIRFSNWNMGHGKCIPVSAERWLSCSRGRDATSRSSRYPQRPPTRRRPSLRSRRRVGNVRS